MSATTSISALVFYFTNMYTVKIRGTILLSEIEIVCTLESFPAVATFRTRFEIRLEQPEKANLRGIFSGNFNILKGFTSQLFLHVINLTKACRKSALRKE